MKNPIYFFVFASLLLSCTSNTIYEKPKDLIPKDTMVMLLKDLYVATSSRGVSNINQQKKISYIHLVYEKYKIDSLRFKTSNLYYISKVDEYKPMIDQVLNLLEKEKVAFEKIKKTKDSILNDSLRRKKTAAKDKIMRNEKTKFSRDLLKKNRTMKKKSK